MKTNFKRLFALVLTLCMLASLMVPVAFAEDEAVAAPSANVAETYQIRVKDLTNLDADTAVAGTLEYLMTKADSDNGGRKWNTSPTASAFTSAYSSGLLNWNVYGATTELTYRTDRMWQLRSENKNVDGVADWAALKIRVTNPGAYALNMYTDKATTAVEGTDWSNAAASWKGTVNAYIIPLSVADAAESVADLMTDKYSVGSAYMAAEDTSITFDQVRMAAGEYVVVYCGTSNITLEKMTLTGEAFAVTEIANYAIRPVELDTKTAEEAYLAGGLASKFVTVTETTNEDGTTTNTYAYITTGNLTIKNNTVGTNALYKAGKLNWQWEAGYTGSYRPSTYQYRLDSPDNSGTYDVAFRIKVPATGFFALTFSTLNDGPYSVDAFVANANDGVAFADMAAEEYSIGSAAITKDKPGIFETKYYEAGEYIVRLNSTGKNDAWLNALGLIQYSSDVIPENNYAASQEISYKLYNIDDPVFDQIVGEITTFAAELSDGNGGTTNLQDYVAALYAEGKLDWKIEAYPSSFTGANFVSEKAHDRGIEVSTPNDTDTATDWFAIRFRVKEAGYYSITSQMTMSTTPGIATYLIPAAEETMTADEIQAQLVPENGLVFRNKDAKSNKAVSVGYLEGEYIIAYKVPYAKNRTFNVQGILLESEAPLKASDVQFYNFDLYDETNCYYPLMTDVYSAVTDETTGVTTYEKKDFLAEGSSANWRDYAGLVLTRDADGNVTSITTGEKGAYAYNAVLKADASGYPDTLNWRPDYACTGTSTADASKIHVFTNGGSYGGGVDFSKDGDGTYIASYTLHVDKAGTYDLSVTAGQYEYEYDIYFVDTMLTDYSARLTAATVANYTAADSPWLLGKVTLDVGKAVKAGTVTVDAAGDYLIIFKTTVQNLDLHLNNITLTPVVEEAAAVVGGETYATFEEAVAAATEGDTISLMENVINGGDIVVPAGVTLNLMGYSVYADSIDASAPGAAIVDPSDGNAALYADEIIFDENNHNPQLPLKDKAAGAYHLFYVDVVSSATTGSGSATKYWFKVNFSNSAALDLIGISTELRIAANMSWVKDEVEGSAVATSTVGFVNQWAAKNTSYIVVTTDGEASGTGSSFRLSPAVTANGVVISGDAMSKNP